MKCNNVDLYEISSDLEGKRISLYSLATWKNGLPFKKIDFSSFGKPIIKISELNNGITQSTAYTEGSYNSDVYLTKGDLVFSWSGNPDTSIDVFRYSLQDGWLNQHIFKVTANDNVVLKDYLYYILKWLKPIFKEIARNKQTTGLGHVTIADLKAINIVVPDLNTQEEFINILKPIDDKIELNNAINHNLQQQVSALYQSRFEDFDLTNGICPWNWSNNAFSTIANISSGKRPPVKSDNYSKETPISIVGAASVMGYTSEANHSDRILVTGRVGTHGVVQRFNTPCWTSDNTLVITSPYYEFAYQVLCRIDYSSMNRGSTQPLITQGDMKKLPVLIPDKKTLLEFETFAGSLMAQWEANNNENFVLASLRDNLLPKLMSGEIDVSEVEI